MNHLPVVALLTSLVVAASCALLAPAAVAQSPFAAATAGGPPSLEQRRAERTANRDKSQKMWDSWRGPSGGGHEALAEIAALRSLRPTKDNANSVLTAMRSKGLGGQDKAMLARIAGGLYRDLDEEGDTQTMESIRAHLADVARHEKDPAYWKAAAFTYSRMGWFPDSMQLFARARFVWGDQIYYSELAHALLSAPQTEQMKILRELEAGDGRHNDFAKEILANDLKNHDRARALHPEVAKATLAMFKNKEPAFPAAPERMGVSSLYGYGDWLITVVSMTAQATGEPPRIVLARMVKPDGDPRKLIGALLQPTSIEWLRTGMDRRTLAEIEDNVNAFAARHKDNPNVQDFVGSARQALVIAKKQ